MRALRIGLDIDGVIYNYDKTVRYMLRTMRGHKDNPALQQEATSWTSTQEAISKHDWDWVWSEAIRLGLFRYGHLYKGSIEGIRALAPLADLVIITQRHPKATQDTLDWLAYLKMPFKEIHVVGKQPKSEIACDLYVDDKIENILDYEENAEGYPLLWRRPWNTTMPVPDAGDRRYGVVNTWEEVVEIARSIRGQG